MSNERRNTNYNKKHNKKHSIGTQSNSVTRSNVVNNTNTIDMTTSPTATNREVTNEMNVSIEHKESPNENNLNESMISTETFESNDISLEHKRPTLLAVHPAVNLFVTTPAPYNPNDVETSLLRLRPPKATTKWRLEPELPEVSKPDTYKGYYDMKVHVESSTTPWLELIEATKGVMNELWKWDPAITIFVYEKKERINDGSYILCEGDFKKINLRNYAKYFFRGAPLPKAGFRTMNVLMTHSMPFDDIMKLSGMTLMEMQCGLYMRTLQAEKTTTIGWAYMSTKHVHK
jgi:hypothetical protein